MPRTFTHLDTKLIHAGEPSPRIEGAVVPPIFQSAMHEYGGEASYHDIRYLRLSNSPNHRILHAKLAAIENAEAALVTASGMAAISATLLSLLGSGDHLLAQRGLYGGTHDFVTQDLPALGIAVDFIDGSDPASWRPYLKPTTRAVYVESITNPLVQVADLPAVVDFAKAHGLVSVIDSTFATPVNFRPIEHGFDLVLHSATKYLNGHSDLVAGAVIGAASLVRRITHKVNHLGGSLDPHACFLLHRGMKTLGLRVRHQNGSALTIARALAAHPVVERVHYPGLESDPGHQRARQLFAGCGGMLSFEVKGGVAAADAFMRHTTLPIIAPSLGGPETLLTRPSRTSHAGMDADERRRLGITDGLIRVSVGLEATEEIVEDLVAALDRVGAATAADS
jgi:cystathionine beta-lyase/cystathionine gamma-synthase